MTDEEIRAAAYRAQVAQREAYARANCARLAGSPSARAALELAWRPLTRKDDRYGDLEGPEDRTC